MNNLKPEPSLDDLLNDPILHALLARDGLKVEEVRQFLEEMKHRLRPAHRKAARRDGIGQDRHRTTLLKKYAHSFMDAFWRPTGIGPVGGLLLTCIREENPTP
jgi:hypothetical protein